METAMMMPAVETEGVTAVMLAPMTSPFAAVVVVSSKHVLLDPISLYRSDRYIGLARGQEPVPIYLITSRQSERGKETTMRRKNARYPGLWVFLAGRIGANERSAAGVRDRISVSQPARSSRTHSGQDGHSVTEIVRVNLDTAGAVNTWPV
jgi:hypothetical protein